MSEMSDTTGARLRKLRKSRKLKQTAVAEAIGIARPFLSMLESDRKDGGIVTLAALARFYNTSLDYIYFGKSNPEKHDEPEIVSLWNNLSEEDQDHLKTLIERFTGNNKTWK